MEAKAKIEPKIGPMHGVQPKPKATPITYGCFYYVLKNNPLYKVLPIVTMGIPPTGLLAAIFLLGEEPTKELFIGGAIIIIGVILIVFNKPQKKN